MPVVHVVIPCYNEAETLQPCLDRLLAAEFPEGWERRILIIDDHSEQETAEIAQIAAEGEEQIALIRHDHNQGKGTALQTGFAEVLESAGQDDVVVVQDADLEYDPNDLAMILAVFERDDVDAVYGDRFAHGRRVSPLGRLHTTVNRGLTHASNLLTGLSIADMECCYKAIRAPILQRILPELDERGFGIEPQITAALARAGARVENHTVSYAPRGFDEGKKIGLKDGVRALFVVARERVRGKRR